MTRYGTGIVACIVLALLYPVFRMEVFDELISRGIRKRDIRRKMKGFRNFWLYDEIEKNYGLGFYGKMIRQYVGLYTMITILHIALGWINSLAGADVALMTYLCLNAVVMIFYSRIRINRRLFGSTFVLFAWEKTLNRNSKLLHTNYYSTIFDILFAAVPLVFPVVMLL